MAVRKTQDFLPQIFQTDTNKKFLSATMDQLISEPTLTNLYGYVGRKFAPTYKDNDSYITESTTARQNYQLEPSVVVQDDSNNVTFFSNYEDYLNKIKYYGGLTDNQSRLFESSYYSYDPLISFDKIVNFSQYYWLPDGPDPVEVDTTGLELIRTYNVTRDVATGTYVYSSDGVIDNSIILPRGGIYKFIVDQPGYPFWIQTELGTDGLLNATPTISSRDVLGVENNGTDSGTIIFNIPQTSAQDRFTSMPTVSTVDYASPLAYSDLENSTLSQFQTNFPQYIGITGQLDGKLMIFVDQDQLNNRGEEIWTNPVVHDNNGNVIPGYDAGTIVAENQRYGIWSVQFIDIGIGDPLIRLVWVQDVTINQKVYVRYGILNANKEYYKDYDGFFHQMPLLSSLANTLFAQDGIAGSINTTFKVVDYNDWTINVDTDIIGKQNYTSPNGVEFTSGLKIQFTTDVLPVKYQNRQYYVEGVGDLGGGIQLVPVDELVTPEAYNDENTINYFGQIFPEYITINRSSLDRNAWARNNRWFHREVISKTAEYRGEVATFDQDQRARRPIVQFEGSIQLFNEGRIAKAPIDILDLTTLDAFTELEGQVLTRAFGVTLYDGLRVIFGNDVDDLVKNKIYTVTLVQLTVDSLGAPSGPKHIKLVKADDGDVETYDTVVVKSGEYKGSQWWYDGVNWNASQQKTQVQQEPLFDVFTSGFSFTTFQPTVGRSLSNYTRSTFKGTRLFGYLKSSAGVNDKVLGFPLSYRNFGTQGDIEFENYFTTDTFTYADEAGVVQTENISTGFLQKIKDRYTLSPKNIWQSVVESSKQYQSIGYVYDGTSNVFAIDVMPEPSTSIPYVKVFRNFKYLTNDQWILVSNQVRLTVSQKFIGDGVTKDFILTNVTSTASGVVVLLNDIPRKSVGYYGVAGLTVSFVTAPQQGDVVDIRVISTPAIGDKIDILIYSNEVSNIGFYQTPLNLDLNAQNTDITTLTLGQLRNHLVVLGQNSTTIEGDVLGISNLRDVDIKQQGGTILQHSAPIPYGELFLLDSQANFIDSLRYAQREYIKFKNKFLELSATLTGIDPKNPIASVDLILTEINKIKNSTFPWFYSDMIPYGTLKNTLNYTVFDPLKTDYELTNIYSDITLSNQSVLIYLNDRQLIKDLEYAFRLDRPAVTILTTLEVDDVVTFVEYANTNGCYVPETPTKLGLWPKWIPEIFEDDTYRQPISVIQGHDGSITPAFNDYRDSFLLELELRIYNNIKIPDTGTYQDIFQVIPGKFRKAKQKYSLNEITQLVSKNFQSWVGNSKLDFATNESFDSNDLFTWNYGEFVDRLDGEQLPGSWRACYQYFYDTIRPHLTPWEMLGFTTKPTWWETYYGPAPYTSGNQLLWQDLEAGRIRYGVRVGIDDNYARPGLTTIIPVDENGNLLPPASLLTANYRANRAAASWAVGQYGPVEFAWRTSSDFPFAVQQAIALAIPAKYFSLEIDTYTYTPFNATWDSTAITGQYLNARTNHHLNQFEILFNGQTINGGIYRGAGYINWIADYIISQGMNPNVKLPSLLENYQVNLAYKVAGFTDQTYLNVLAEQVSPGTTNDTIVIPNENYKVHLNKSSPVQKLVYSAVIVEKTSNGYNVRGYDLNNPFFTIIPSEVNNNSTRITVLNKSAAIYRDYQNLKITVPYGYEFSTPQQVVDFLISYERYLLAQGFTFTESDGDLGEIRNWKLSSKEFLYWTQQGWKDGSILVLSPVANTLNAISVNAITDGISDSQYSSRVIDQNFKLVKNVDYEIMRSPTDFKVTLINSASVIGFVEVDLVQYEHVLIFDNVTVFNDIIYKPESGNRQYRLKLVGQKTANWNGSLYAPGFVYNNGAVDGWSPGRDYLQGDLVQYKNQYYTALQNIIANTEFQFNYWKQIPASEINVGLLPNFSTIAAESKAYYNSYPSIDNKKQKDYSHGLIGYRPRQYLSDLGLTETTQIEFYKGFIKQKGTFNAVNQLIKAEFNNLTSNISLYEEWAIRVGTYGGLDVNPYLEIALDEKAFGVNPSLAEFVGNTDVNRADGVTVFNNLQLYKKSDYYTGNIALNRDATSNYSNDILTAGYVNVDDVDTTLFDLADYTLLNNRLAEMGSGYLIWVAKDLSQQWNVYRVTETNNHAILITKITTGFISFTFKTPHGLNTSDIFIVRGFSDTFDGVYQVYEQVDLNTVVVTFSGDTKDLDTPLAGYAIYFVLVSMRFRFMEDSRVYGQPPNQWKVGDKIWIDNDAETTAVQGQPYGTQPSGTWKVYEKQHPWNLKESLAKSTDEYTADDGYGTSVKMSADGLIVVTGSPWSGNGTVTTFLKNYQGEFKEGFGISPVTANTSAFGFSIDLAIDNSNTSKLAVGAPYSGNASVGNIGLVSVYSKPSTATSYSVNQILAGSAGDKFGYSLTFNQDGKWLYVGAPGQNRVYLYGLNTFIPYRQQIISVNNLNTITLGNTAGPGGAWVPQTITVSKDDVITEPITGARIKVTENAIANSTIYVNSLTNIIPAPGATNTLANIQLNTAVTANVGGYITQIGSNANIQIYKTIQNSTKVYGFYVSVDRFNTSGNIIIYNADGNVTLDGSVSTVPVFVGNTGAQIVFSGNITANIGDTVRQYNGSGNWANATVFATYTVGNTKTVTYANVASVFALGNANATVSVNGISTAVYPTRTSLVPIGPGTWANVGVKPTTVGYGNLFLNGSDTGLYANITTSVPYQSNIRLGFQPEIDDVNSLLIVSGLKTYIPGLEYTLDRANSKVIFNGNITQSDITVRQQPYYASLGIVTGANVGASNSDFGYALSSSFDGAQLAVGAPKANVFVGNTWIEAAGAVYVYDRTIEAFSSTGSSDYTTFNEIKPVHRVTIDGIEVSDYFVNTKVTSNDTIRFTTPPAVGKVVYVETNHFELLEKLVGIDSLEGGTGAIQTSAYFGTSLTICSNNCAIYIGAPNYSNGTSYNTGAVWKFHNRGRLYGTNNGYTYNPVFTPGDTIRLDNFEIMVSARMMPTTVVLGTTALSANILALSSNIVAVTGQTIGQYLGSGYWANVTVLANTGPSGGQFITVSNYTTGNVFNYGFNNNVSVGNTSVMSATTAYPMASLDSLIKDINDAKLLGITAVNENDRLRLRSDSTVAKNLLRILSGSTQPNSRGVYASADLIVFAFMQIIINPFGAANEYFGSKVKLASNAYMLVIGSARGTTRGFATLDAHADYYYPNAVKTNADGTVNTFRYLLDPKSTPLARATRFDNDTTRMFDAIKSSGSVYIYELYDDPRNDVEDPGRYAYAQQLNPGDLNTGDQFGYALDIEAEYITITAPGDDSVIGNAGSIYVFENPMRTRGWNLIRYQQPTVDIDSLTRLYLYSNITNKIVENLQYIDPAKGRILGQADQEISYKTDYDPAIYNRGFNPLADINSRIYWNGNQIGKVWWNLSKVRFIDYEQDTLTYRSINWGTLFPDSEIEVCEWVESDWLPSQYVARGGNGIPKYADNSAYVQITFVDPVTNIIGSKYYYWVKNKTTVDPNDETRNIPTSTIAEIIANPKNQGVPYAAVIKNNAIIFYNLTPYLSAKNTILHLDYQQIRNSNLIHSEYELIQKDNPVNFIPDKIINRLIDSLAGIDELGSVVPDPKLSLADRYGISTRPRQSMFVDQLPAVTQLVAYVNAVMITKPISRQYDLTQLNAAESIPNANLGIYVKSVATDIELGYLDVAKLTVGDKVLVEQDTTQDNLWVIYELTADRQWQINQVQSYKTSLYWGYIDWYAEGYGPDEQIEYVVDTLPDALKLPVAIGDEVLIKVNNYAGVNQGWNLLTVLSTGEFKVVGIENGTLQLKTSLGNFADNSLGFGNQGYSTNRYDQNPNIELRKIITALKNDIFINELQGEFNKLFFVLVNYLFSEQKFVDWIFKTSFISVSHNLRTLSQFPNYIQDNQTYYQSYIEEVKPYRTKLREYLINYTGNDEYPSTVTDFDLPPYYDTTSKIFRSPSGEIIDTDQALWQTYPYNNWYNNRTLVVDSIRLDNPGLGYTTPPTVTILNDAGGGSGAAAVAYIDGNTGSVTRIEVTKPGKGYVTTPTVIVNGSATVSATAYAVIKNNQVRTFDTTLKFDRVSYTSLVKEWSANTAYTKTVFDANGYVISGDVITYSRQEGATSVRRAYTVNANIISGNAFMTSDYTVYNPANIKTANDRIIGYYQPTDQMPARDLNQLIYGIEYPGVQVQGLDFQQQPGFPGATTAKITLSAGSNVAISAGNVIVQAQGSLTVTAVISSTVYEGVLNSDGFVTGTGNVSILEGKNGPWEGNLLLTSAYPAAVSYVRRGGTPFGTGAFDNVSYDAEGNPMLSDDAVDTIIRSTYTDAALGTRAEDINVDGGKYVDRYSSHAPEEMIPGIMFDTLDMRIYTQANASIYGYRIFNNMLRDTSYLRIADRYTTALANVLSITDGNIIVSNSSVLPTPDPSTRYPGVVFIGSERITYWTNNKTTNTLGQIRRSTEGTAAANTYPIGTLVTDASYIQQIPGMDTLDVKFIQLQFSNNITANIGDYITQPSTGAGFRVVSTTSNVANVAVTYIGIFKANLGQTTSNANVIAFNGNITSIYPVGILSTVTLQKTVTTNPTQVLRLSTNISANIGDTITQVTSGANATVLSYENVFGNLVLVSYNNAARFDMLSGNAIIDSNIAINGIYTSNITLYPNGPIYPISSNIAGFVGLTDGGNVNVTVSTNDVATINANTRLQQSNVWYNIGTGTATDGTGLEGATTESALFIKQELAILNATSIKPDELVTEDAINTLTTEGNTIVNGTLIKDGTPIIEE